jgi:hypothetical protein
MGLHGLLQGRGLPQDVIVEYGWTDWGKLRKTCSSMTDVPTEFHTRDEYLSEMTLKHSYLAVIHDVTATRKLFKSMKKRWAVHVTW